jgi:hypothetical protein
MGVIAGFLAPSMPISCLHLPALSSGRLPSVPAVASRPFYDWHLFW